MMKGKNRFSWYGQFASQYVAFPFRVWCTKNLSIDHNMLSRRLVARFPHLNILARASSNGASTPGPLAPVTDSSVTSQSPNYPTTWSTNQQPRPAPRSGPRFEHTFMELQPNPLSAMELVANEPVRVVHGRKAVCDGGEQWHTHDSSRVADGLGRRRTSWSSKDIHQPSAWQLHFLVLRRFADMSQGSTWSSAVRVRVSLPFVFTPC